MEMIRYPTGNLPPRYIINIRPNLAVSLTWSEIKEGGLPEYYFFFNPETGEEISEYLNNPIEDKNG
jgi:hypothetical protein